MPEATGNSDFVVGVDLGGTKIQAGIYDARLSLIGSAKASTKAERGVGDVLAASPGASRTPWTNVTWY